ncbi:MAG TPA: diguanylate cyclase, partial [Mycobacterium sp.]
LADRDPATGLRNQRGFQRALELENGRIRRFGTTASVLVIDVNDPAASPGREAQLAGDSGLISCAGLLAGVAQPGDVLARIDPSVFALLAVGTDAAGAQAMRTQLAQALRTADLTAAIGTATHRAGEDLADTWQQASACADRRHR